MVSTVYIEEEVRNHPRTRQILARFPDARRVGCERYGEVFNPRAQSFRLQKKAPSLILARKHRNHILEAPDGYGIGGGRNFYFSHMLNCPYDCRYCFLQGMFRSAHYVVFVNYEDFVEGIERRVAENPGSTSFFFSGYDCDSLAFEGVTGFADYFLDSFAALPDAWLELRTKSTRIGGLLERSPLENCVVAFSLTPDEVARALEHQAPSLKRRIEAMRKLAAKGWKIGLRFDPLIYQEGWQDQYRRLFSDVFEAIEPASIHSVSLGSFRLPASYFRSMTRLYPEEKLFASPLEDDSGMVSYEASLEQEIFSFCEGEILRSVSRELYFPCLSEGVSP